MVEDFVISKARGVGGLDGDAVHTLGYISSGITRARKIFEFLLGRWASNPQIWLAGGTSPLAQVFKLINNS